MTLTIAQPGGVPPVNAGWAQEMALDVEWVHAIAPGANILVVQALSNSGDHLLQAIDYANAHGVDAVTMSWGGDEYPGSDSLDDHFSQPGVSYFASTGDDGAGVSWPAVSAKVVAVGGTNLTINNDGTRNNETAWTGSGGGISAYIAEPSYQSNYPIPNTNGKRAVPDVSFVADPSTGVAVCYNGSWYQVGGTSLSAPCWAALSVLGDDTGVSWVYAKARASYATSYNDVTGGNNGGYSAAAGYDFVTGLGSPKASAIAATSEGRVAFLTSSTELGSDPSLYWDNANKRLGVGSISPEAPLHVLSTVAGAPFTLQQSGSTPLTALYDNWGAGTATSGAGFLARFARGTKDAPANVGVGDRLGFNVFGGLAGGAWRHTAAIEAMVDTGTVSATSLPTYLRFLTTPDGSVTRTEAMRISANGNVGIGTTSPEAPLHVLSTVAGAPFTLQQSGSTPLTALYDNWGAGTATSGAGFLARFARGTKDAPANVAVGDRLGFNVFGGLAGGAWRHTAAIEAMVDTGTVSATSLPTYLRFLTTPDGSVTRTEAMRISANGNVTISGNLTVGGVKNFVTPDPSDSTKSIYYAALEGPEAGTYVRGSAEVVAGAATIELPSYFSGVTADKGLSAQLTPAGKWLQLYVIELSPTRIVVGEATGQSGSFYYLINGVRRGYEAYQVIRDAAP